MIPVQTSMTQIDTLPGEEVEFTIGDPRFVMQSMADLYSNREGACVREYSTNAFDAAKERALRLGIDIPPIEVTLPSMMNPHFKVRDFGDGMSAQTLKSIYTSFGVSTKRDSNDFNGLLGFGSKSALAYTDTFTVTSIHEGIKSVAVITRRPDWSIVLKLVGQSKSTDRSGTEVSVPVHNWHEFNQKANDFYSFWLPGTVKVNGVEPAHNVGEKVIDGLYHSQNWNASYVVMGNVPYRVTNPSALFHNSALNHLNFVAYVDNGNVEFTPSREDLKYTEHTKAELQKIVDNFGEKIIAKAKAEIAAAKTAPEAFSLWQKWSNVLSHRHLSRLTFNGKEFQSDFKIDAHVYRLTTYRTTVYRTKQFNVESMKSTLVVTDFDINLASAHKNKAKEYATLKGYEIRTVLFTHQSASDIKCDWITKDQFVSWEDLKAALPKVPRQSRPASLFPTRIKGSWDIITRDGEELEKELPSEGEVYWIAHKEANRLNVRTILTMLDSDATVIRVPLNRLDKFKRDNPDVENFLTWAQTHVVKDGPSLLSDEAKKVFGIRWDTQRWLQFHADSEFLDPELNEIRDAMKDRENLLTKYNQNLALAEQVNMRYNGDVTEFHPDEGDVFDVSEKYPLVRSGSAMFTEHEVIYVNAVYSAEQENNNV